MTRMTRDDWYDWGWLWMSGMTRDDWYALE